MSKFAEAMLQLADCYQSAANDVHTLHLNFVGCEFDSMHKNTLEEYYEALGSDADDMYERAIGLGLDAVPPLSNAATRIAYASFEGKCDRSTAIERVNSVLEEILKFTHLTYQIAESEGKQCPIACGIASYLQDKLSFWGKEQSFFNKRRFEGRVADEYVQ